MQLIDYDVLFDGRWMASIASYLELTSIQASGITLPNAIIDEMGFRRKLECK